jgi:hypothetical protein
MQVVSLASFQLGHSHDDKACIYLFFVPKNTEALKSMLCLGAASCPARRLEKLACATPIRKVSLSLASGQVSGRCVANPEVMLVFELVWDN